MVGRVHGGQLPECRIVRALAVLGRRHAPCLVVRIVGNQVATVHIGREDKRVVEDQFDESLSFRLDGVVDLEVLHEVVVEGRLLVVEQAVQVGKVSVEVNIIGVVASN